MPEPAQEIRENVGHIARGCRSGRSHNPAVHEQAIDAAVDALVAERDRYRDAIESEIGSRGYRAEQCVSDTERDWHHERITALEAALEGDTHA